MHKKSHLMKTGPLLDLKLPSLILRGGELETVNEVKYLGIVFNTGKKEFEDVNFNWRRCLD